MNRIIAAALVAAIPVCSAGGVPPAIDRTTQSKLGALAVPFVPNAGQWDPRAAFAADLSVGVLFVTTEGQLVYRLPGVAKAAADDPSPGPAHRPTRPDRRAGAAPERGPGWVLTETLIDATGRALHASPQGTQALAGEVSYAIGNDESRHRDGLRTYERVSLGEVYPGITVQLRATGHNVEKIFTVAPGHDPEAILVRIDGATRLEVGSAGELIAHTGNGPVAYTAPIAYQENAAGRRSDVTVTYAVDPATSRYGFTLGAYDAGRPVIIDPLLQSTYVGGDGGVNTYALAIHPVTGDVYVAGTTYSTDLPKAAGAEQTVKGAGSDAFVTRLNAALTSRLQSTYLGGNGNDNARALAIHPATGEVYVAGDTTSTDFSKVAGAEQTVRGGVGNLPDAFVTRLNATLTTRLQSTYLGGSGEDIAYALAIHPTTGEVYVAGHSNSNDFPKVAGAGQSVKGVGTDGFVTRLNAALTSRLQSTYLGGSGVDVIYAVAIHPTTGEIYVAGETGSTDFPTVAGAEQALLGAGRDGFVTRLNGALTARLQSTYLGGSGDDIAYSLAIHPTTGEPYVAGRTDSTDFPKVAGAEQSMNGGGYDGFVTRLNAALTSRLQSTYLGGNGADGARGLAIHPTTGEVYVAGTTASTDFPKVGGAEQRFKALGSDAFVSRLNAALTARLQSTYLGGNGDDIAYALAIHPTTGEVYVAGQTYSTEFPTVAGAEQTVKSAVENTFVSRYHDLSARNCLLDVDGNGAIDALTDGLLLIRAMFGLTGAAVTNGAIGGGSPTRPTWAQIRPFLYAHCGVNLAP